MNLIDIRSSWNHLKKNRVHTLLNVLGLALGLLFFLQLVTYIAYEKGYDKFFRSGDQVYRINYDVTQNNESVLHSAKTPRRLFRVLKEEVPEIEFTAITYYEDVLVKYEEQLFSEQRDLWVQGDFTEIFSLEMIRGEAKLNDAFNCIISESKAREIFADEDPIGKVIWVNEGMRHAITGIFKNLPANCHIDCDYFMPIRTWVEIGSIPNQENFRGASWWTYIKIAEGADPEKVEKDLEQVSKKYLTHLENENRIGKFSLQPLARLHFTTDRAGEFGTSTRERTVYTLIVIAALILTVIWMNYVNMSTAVARKRLDVFATYRKLGATKVNLLGLSIIETLMINSAAIILATILYFLTSRLFSRLIDTPISDGYINYSIIAILMVVVILTGIIIMALTASVPSLKVNPALLQQRKITKNSGSLWLAGMQFFMSCLLVICLITVAKQIRFMEKADLGINLNNVVVLRGAASTHLDPLRREHFNALREEVLQLNEFMSGTASMNVPGQPMRSRISNLARPDKLGELQQEVTLGNIDDGYIETYGLKLLAGRNFEQPIRLDSAKVIVSESIVKILDYGSPENAIGKQLRIGNNNFTIKGVMNDFHHEGLKRPLEPVIFNHRHPIEFGFYSFRIRGDIQRSIAQLQAIWPKHYPNDPCDYFLADDYFLLQYREEIRLIRIITAFTIFAILVTALGLFGLVSSIAEQRTREIGLRKVNGATIKDIMLMMLSYFTKFEIPAFILACIIAWLIMKRWLQGFAYQTDFSLWIILMTGIIAFIIATVSVLIQSYRASAKNPAEVLRYE